MTKEEFRTLSQDDKLVQIIYDCKRGIIHTKYFPYCYYKNFGNSHRDSINKYNNHYVTRTCDNNYEMWCTEDKLNVALNNLKEILIKREKELVDKAINNIKVIARSQVVAKVFPSKKTIWNLMKIILKSLKSVLTKRLV